MEIGDYFCKDSLLALYFKLYTNIWWLIENGIYIDVSEWLPTQFGEIT